MFELASIWSLIEVPFTDLFFKMAEHCLRKRSPQSFALPVCEMGTVGASLFHLSLSIAKIFA